MARYTGPKNKLARKFGEDLGLKTNALKLAKRLNVLPGQHGRKGRKKVSEYGKQLSEKQKVKMMYGLMEKQFHKIYEVATKTPSATGFALLRLLERRLDNTLFRLGFASSRSQARQIVRHNHILVNGKKVNIPSYTVLINDVITVKEKSRQNSSINESLDAVVRRGVPSWLELDRDNFKGVVKVLPDRQEISMPIQEQLIVELYSK